MVEYRQKLFRALAYIETAFYSGLNGVMNDLVRLHEQSRDVAMQRLYKLYLPVTSI